MVVPARVALVLERAFDFNKLRVRLRGHDAEVDDVLLALHVAALRFTEAAAGELPANGSTLARSSEVPAGLTMMTASDVADVAECTGRAVTLAATEHRLDGVKLGGCWMFRVDEVAAWAATRRRSRNR